MITKGEAQKLYEKGVDAVYLYLIELEKKYKQEQPKAAAPVVSVAAKPELNITLPSVRALHRLTREQQPVRLTLKTGDVLTGQVRWVDPECLCLEDNTTVTVVWQRAIAFLQGVAET
ncbi:MAG: Hfq-related RNA-binding protein [Pseudanabaenaceae cyanobacterium]